MTAAIHGLSHKALKHFRKNPAALAVYWVYVSRTNVEGVAYPALRGLAKDIGFCKDTCKKSRDWLVSVKALERVETYERPEWRELPDQDKTRRINLDKAEYYRVTGYIEVKGERIYMLYHGSLEKSVIDYENSDVLHSLTSDGIDHRRGLTSETARTELNTLKELNTIKDAAPEIAAVSVEPTIPESPQPEIAKPSEQKQALTISHSDKGHKRTDKKPPSSAPPPALRIPQKPVFNAFMECAYKIQPGTRVPKATAVHINRLVKTAEDAFEAVFKVKDDEKIANAVRTFYRDEYPPNGKLTPVQKIESFSPQFLAFLQNYRKPKPQASIHAMPDLPPPIEDTPELRAQRNADIEAYRKRKLPQEKSA